MDRKNIFITGSAGYIGAMLAHQFSLKDEVEKVICLDKDPIPDFIKNISKIVWIRGNTNNDFWQDEVSKYRPEIVIHTAWQIREMYGKRKLQREWNVFGSKKVFDFAFENSFVKKLIHFSTVASYSAYPENNLDYFFTEKDPLRYSDYLYAEEKREVEDILKDEYEKAVKKGPPPEVFVVRPVSITGPRGRFMKIRFGLQSALSGNMKGGSLTHKLVSFILRITPITAKWCRQYIHEDDVNDIVSLLALSKTEKTEKKFEIFNICPPGDYVSGKDMAKALNKKYIVISPWIIRVIFFLVWHLSLGKIPVSKGGWKSYSYPILVKGNKISEMFGYKYKASSIDSFTKKDGRYSEYI